MSAAWMRGIQAIVHKFSLIDKGVFCTWKLHAENDELPLSVQMEAKIAKPLLTETATAFLRGG